jgi:ribokinase
MDAIGFGALNLDVIYRVNEIPKEDEECFVESIEIHPGGSAANTIVGLARLNMKTGYIGKVGSDEKGKILIGDFQKEGVDTTGVIRSEGRSGCAMVFVDGKGCRAILIDPGVNDTILYNEIDTDYVSKFRVLHLTSFVCGQNDASFRSQTRLVNEIDISISFDPGIMYVRRGLDDLRDIIKRTTIFMPNEREIHLLTGKNYREAAIEIIELGTEIVAVKLGRKGCYITDGREEIKLPAMTVKPVDTTGAGDAFNTGFLYGYLKEKSLEECGKLGNLVASLSVLKIGARTGLPREENLR